MLLSEAPKNVIMKIKEIMDMNSLLMQHGITPGENLRVITNYSTQPMLIEVRNCFIALDHYYAKKILVEITKSYEK